MLNSRLGKISTYYTQRINVIICDNDEKKLMYVLCGKHKVFHISVVHETQGWSLPRYFSYKDYKKTWGYEADVVVILCCNQNSRFYQL